MKGRQEREVDIFVLGLDDLCIQYIIFKYFLINLVLVNLWCFFIYLLEVEIGLNFWYVVLI